MDIIIHNSVIQKSIQDQINQYIKKQSLFEIKFHKVKFNLLSLRIDVYNLEIRNFDNKNLSKKNNLDNSSAGLFKLKQADESLLLASIDHMSMYLSLSSLYKGKIKFSSIVVNKSNIDIKKLANLAKKFIKNSQSSKTKFNTPNAINNIAYSVPYARSFLDKIQLTFQPAKSDFYILDLKNLVDKVIVKNARLEGSKINLTELFQNGNRKNFNKNNKNKNNKSNQKKSIKSDENIFFSSQLLDLTVDMEKSSKLTGRLNISGVGLQKAANSLIKSAALTINFDYLDNLLTIKKVSLDSEKLNLNLNAKIVLNKNSFVSENITFISDVKIDLAILGNFNGFQGSKGLLNTSLKGWINPTRNVWEIVGSANYLNIKLEQYNLYNGKFNFSIHPKQLEINNWQIENNSELLANIAGSIMLNSDLDFLFNFKPINLNISKIYHAINLKNPVVDAELSQDPFTIYGKINPFILYIKTINTFDNFRIKNFYESHKNNNTNINFKLNCRFSILWIVNLHAFDFNKTTGKCNPNVLKSNFKHLNNSNRGNSNENFDNKNNSKNTKDSEFIDLITFDGRIDFSQGLDLAITVATDDISAYQNFTFLAMKGQSSYHRVTVKGGFYDVKTTVSSKAKNFFIANSQLGDLDGSIVFDHKKNKLLFKKIIFKSSESSDNYANQKHKKDNLDNKKISGFVLSKGSYDFDKYIFKSKINAFNAELKVISTLLNNFKVVEDKFSGFIKNLDLTLNLDFSNYVNLDLSGLFHITDFSYNDYNVKSINSNVFLDKNNFILKNTTFNLLDNFYLNLALQLSRSNKKTHKKTKIKSKKYFLSPVFAKDSIINLKIDADHANLDAINLANFKKAIVFDKFNNFDKANKAKINTNNLNSNKNISLRTKMSADIKGSLKNLYGNILIPHINFYYQDKIFLSTKSQVYFNGDNLNFLILSSDKTMGVKFNYSLIDKNYNLQANIKRLNILSYLNLFNKFDLLNNTQLISPSNYLFFSAELNLTGNLKNKSSTKGNLHISSLDGNLIKTSNDTSGKFFNFGLDNKVNVQLTTDNFKLNEPLVLKSHAFRVNIMQSKKNSWHDFGFKIFGSLSQSQIADSLNFVNRAEGVAVINGFLNYNKKSKLDYNLNIKLLPEQYGYLTLDNYNPSFNSLSYDIDFSNEGLIINSLKASQGSGLISISGRVLAMNKIKDLKSNKTTQPVNIKLLADQANFSVESKTLGVVTGTYSADLELSGTSFPFDLDGNVVIHNFMSNKPIKIYDGFVKNAANNSLQNVSSQVSDRSNKYVNLNIDIESNDSIFINNYPVELNIGGRIKITGNFSEPELGGFFRVAKGKVFYKREYKITEGGLYFSGSQAINPIVEITGKSNISGYEVTFRVSGALSDPVIEFFVNPTVSNNGVVLSQTDILFLITNGRLPERDVSWQTQQDVLISEALNVTVFNLLNERLTNLVKASNQNIIKNLTIQSYSSEKIQGTKLKAVAPIYVGPEDLNVVLEGRAQSVGFRAEYELDPNILTSLNYMQSLQEENENNDPLIDSRIESSIDLRFRFSFP